MSYQVHFTPSGNRDFRKLPKKVQALLAPRIDALADEPRQPSAKKLESPHNLWSLREGDYRLTYQLRDTLLVVVIARAGHRRDVYRQLDRVGKALRDSADRCRPSR